MSVTVASKHAAEFRVAYHDVVQMVKSLTASLGWIPWEFG